MVNGGKTYFHLRDSNGITFTDGLCPGGRLPVVLDAAAFSALHAIMSKNISILALKLSEIPLTCLRLYISHGKINVITQREHHIFQ